MVTKVIAPAPALSVASAPKVTASLYTCPPAAEVVTAPPLIAVVPPASVVNVVSAFVFPLHHRTWWYRSCSPPESTGPSTVLAKVIAPAPALSVVFAPRVTASSVHLPARGRAATSHH